MNALERYMTKNQSSFGIRLFADGETVGSLELVLFNVGNKHQGFFNLEAQVADKMRVNQKPLAKGTIVHLQTLLVQSGIHQLTEYESDAPLTINGIEYAVLDGMAYRLEIISSGKTYSVNRYHRCESGFAMLYNAIIRACLCDEFPSDIASYFHCSASEWDPVA